MELNNQDQKRNKPTFNWNAAVRSAIRRVFARSPKVRDVMNAGKRKVPHYNKDNSRAKVDRVEFECQVCHTWLPAKLMSGVDHIVPVISVEKGFQDWNTYISRIDCPIQNLQRVCKECHQKKSNDERNKRNALKDKVALDLIEERLKSAWTIAEEKELKKQVSKFLSKTKSLETRERALRLKQILIDKITRED